MKLHSYTAWILSLSVSMLLGTGCTLAENNLVESSFTGQTSARIIAIGDLHGDYEAFTSLLTQAGLINHRGKWTGGDTILIQTGDIPDRGPDSLKIIQHLQKLQKQARRRDGQVITLVGNHEAMNMIGDLRYVHAGEYAAFATRGSENLRERAFNNNHEAIEAFYLANNAALSSVEIKNKWFKDTPLGKLEHHAAWRPDGDVGRWIAGNPAIAIVGDSLFVHAGISEKYTHFSVAEMNALTREALLSRTTSPDNIINDSVGPLWYRGNVRQTTDIPSPAMPPPQTGSSTPAATSQLQEINIALNSFGIVRIIVGHTPARQGIRSTYGGKVIQIDTGIAKHYGGTQSFLEIRNGVLYAHDNGVVSIIRDDENEGIPK